MPSITQLEYILAVDRFRHFSKAAEHVHVSQPTLSAQIQKAEEELGITIFDRNKKPLTLTAQGARFVEQAKIVLREHQKLIRGAQSDTEIISGDLRVAVIPTLITTVVPKLISVLSRTLPSAEIHLDELKTSEIIRALKDDQLDFAILATPLEDDRLRELPIFYERFFVFASKGHTLLRRTEVTEKDLSSEDLWLLREGHCLRRQTLSLCGGDTPRNIFPNIHFEGGSTETLVELVRQSQGYTLIPELQLNLLDKAEIKDQVRPLKNPAPCREISLVCKKTDWRASHFRKLRDQIQACFPQTMHKRPNPRSEVLGLD